jgi:iron complex outermembrane receptor protein
MTGIHIRVAAGLLAATSLTAIAAPAVAQADSAGQAAFNIPAGELSSALQRFARQSHTQVIYSVAELRGRRSQGVSGRMSSTEALQRLVDGSGASLIHDPSGAFLVHSDPSAGEGQAGSAAANNESAASDIVVTGSRVRGASSTSPVIVQTERQIREAGQVNLGQVIRSIPQNFNGGQNPGIRNGGGNILNQNISAGSALNLRGIGPNATLTLLNGRRLSYDSFTQAIDIDTIPLAAIDRIEIVADGASAIYGSDAVAGVANIILRRDDEGITTSARLGTSTRGGKTEQQYSISGGTRWSGGGFIASYDFQDAEALYGTQRSYTQGMPQPSMLFPHLTQHSVVVSGHQELAPALTLSVDALYNRRDMDRVVTYFSTYSQREKTRVESAFVSPVLTLQLPHHWSVAASGSFGSDETNYTVRTLNLDTAAQTGLSIGCYCNRSTVAELNAEGPLFAFGGGTVRAAVGAGYRRNDFLSSSLTSTSRTEGSRASRYVYGELFIPLVTPDSSISFIHSLSLTGALRHEDYGSIGRVTTPKLGFNFAPIPDVEITGSWGKSFKAADLLATYQPFIAYLWSTQQLGGVGYPPGSTVLMSWGGNRDLKPERATTWTAAISARPHFLPNTRIELSYFRVRYQDRVAQPLSPYSATLSNPIFAEFLNFTPTPSEIQALVAQDLDGINNSSGLPFNPSSVVAIAQNQYINVAFEQYSGVDLSVTHTAELPRGTLVSSLQASWIESSKRNSALAPTVQLAGTVYDPPHLRMRGGMTWRNGGLTLSAFANYTGPLRDDRTPTGGRLGAQTTFDLAAIYATGPGSSIFQGLEFSISMTNLTDRAPPFLPYQASFQETYDSTNYSPIGRYINFGIRKRW